MGNAYSSFSEKTFFFIEKKKGYIIFNKLYIGFTAFAHYLFYHTLENKDRKRKKNAYFILRFTHLLLRRLDIYFDDDTFISTYYFNYFKFLIMYSIIVYRFITYDESIDSIFSFTSTI